MLTLLCSGMKGMGVGEITRPCMVDPNIWRKFRHMTSTQQKHKLIYFFLSRLKCINYFRNKSDIHEAHLVRTSVDLRRQLICIKLQ